MRKIYHPNTFSNQVLDALPQIDTQDRDPTPILPPKAKDIEEITRMFLETVLGEHLTHSSRATEIEGVLPRLSREIDRSIIYAVVTGAHSPEDFTTLSSYEIAQLLLGTLDGVRNLINADALAMTAIDPSQKRSRWNDDDWREYEAAMKSPGVNAIARYRIARAMRGLGIPLIPNIMAENGNLATTINLSPQANIGEKFSIFGAKVTVGPHVTIGEGASLYGGTEIISNGASGVVLGARVTMREGAKIIGGDIRVGDEVVIYPNATVTESVLPYARVRAV